MSALAFSAEDYCIDQETKEDICEHTESYIPLFPMSVKQSEICLGYSYFGKRSEKKILQQKRYFDAKEAELLRGLELAEKGLLSYAELLELKQKAEKYDYQVDWYNSKMEKIRQLGENYKAYNCPGSTINPAVDANAANLLAKKLMKEVWDN